MDLCSFFKTNLLLQDPCTEADMAEQCLLGLLKRVHAKKKKLGTDRSEGKDVTMFEEVSKTCVIILSTYLISNIRIKMIKKIETLLTEIKMVAKFLARLPSPKKYKAN